MLKIIFTSIFCLLLVIFITENVVEVLRKQGWDQFLSRLGNAVFSNIVELPRHWLWLIAAFATGGTIALWLNVYLQKIHIIRPNIPTSIHVQFTEGSNNVTQLRNENINNTLFERAVHNYVGEKGKVLGQNVVWYIFLTFQKPTHYGQIIVDAGNAAIPEWKVINQKDSSVVIRFLGDIGNVALTIKTIPPNP